MSTRRIFYSALAALLAALVAGGYVAAVELAGHLVLVGWWPL